MLFQAVLFLFIFPFPPKMNRVKFAGRLAVAAGDALVIPHFSDIHFARAQAGVTVHAFAIVHLDGKQRDFIEETVKRA
jgi:precorrin-6B methylase 1